MKKPILMVALVVAAFVQTMFANNEKSNSATVKIYVSSKFIVADQDPLQAVLSAYLDLKNALAKDDKNMASTSATTFFNAIDKMPMDKLTAAQHKVWMKYSEKLTYDADHIKGAPNMDHMREHFVSLSKNMYNVVKGFNTNTANIYYQFCPMANDGKGAYWVSEMEKISNPYLGKKMPTCGSTKETLPPKK